MVRIAACLFAAGCVMLVVGCPSVADSSVQPASNESGAPSTGAGTATPAEGANLDTSVFGVTLRAEFPACDQIADEARSRQTVLGLVNAARAELGYDPVRQNQKLEEQATQYACEMIQHDFFAHDNPVTGTNLADRADEFGYRYLVIGENLAAGQPTAEKVFLDWMNSPGHRANILDSRFTELGIGIRRGGSLGTYWVQEFGRPFTDPFPTPSIRTP